MLLVTLDVKRLYTNVPVEEAAEIALKKLYSKDEVPEIPRSATKNLLRLAARSVQFENIKMCYNKLDGLTMSAFLVIFLSNLWMKSTEN